MAEKIKVVNMMKSGITINLTDFNGKQIPLAGEGFAYLQPDELAYVRNTSRAFERGSLTVEGDLPKDIDIPKSANALSKVDIEALLRKPVKQLEHSLKDIDSEHTVRSILEAAKDTDKSVKSIDAIQKRLDEVIG